MLTETNLDDADIIYFIEYLISYYSGTPKGDAYANYLKEYAIPKIYGSGLKNEQEIKNWVKDLIKN